LFDRVISRVIVAVVSIVMGLMIVQISLDAFLRTAFGTPLPATVEIVSNYYMVALSFLPLALAQRQNRHIEASVVYDLLPTLAQGLSRILARLSGIVIYAFLAWQTFLDALEKTAVRAYALAGTTEIPIWPCYWLLPISFSLLVVALLLPPQDKSLLSTDPVEA
jgi:TRAP-type C4-dicarboxylate transport system permease small subunit